MKPDVSDLVAIHRGFVQAREMLERHRFERIRKSSILVDGPILQDALESAKFLGAAKQQPTGLTKLRSLLTRMQK